MPRTILHPRTLLPLRPVGYRADGRPIWPILGAAEEGGEGAGGQGGQQTATGQGGGEGFQPITSQEEFDARIQDRLRRATSKYADYDQLKEKAARADALELELSTDAEKAAAKARDEAKAEANGHWTPRVVRAEFKAAAKGVLTGDQLDALLEDVDLSKYVTSSGDVDEDKIDKKVKAFAPSGGNGGGQQQRHITLGQGQQQQAQAKKGDAGRAMAAKRFGTKASA